MPVPYNPFSRELMEIDVKELSILREVAEGWYIEYKRERKPQKDIAKSLAAFANHYGGWIFYGVAQAPDGSNRAGSFPGISNEDVVLLVEHLRNATKDNINPSPYYEHRILNGPCDEIGLPKDRSIVVVLIPSGPDTPYIHSDGKIYRRIADSSDPKAEIDRFILDHLWQRRQQAHTKIKEFIEQTNITSKEESSTSYLDLFILPDPLGGSGQRTKLSFERFSDILGKGFEKGISSPYNNFYTMPDGFVARQIYGTNNPHRLNNTFRHYGNGFSWITLLFSSTVTSEIRSLIEGYKHVDEFIKTVADYDGSIIDVNHLLFLVIASFGQHKKLMIEGGIKGPLYAKVGIHNVWRRIPFLDAEEYHLLIAKNGLPVIQFEDAFIPPYKSFDSLKLIISKSDDPLESQVNEGSQIVFDILNGLGIPASKSMAQELIDAGSRSNEINENRLKSIKKA